MAAYFREHPPRSDVPFYDSRKNRTLSFFLLQWYQAATDQIVEPLGVLWDREHWYLVGRKADGSRDTRFWRADRVIELRPQMQPVQVKQNFDIQACLGRNWLRSEMQRWAKEAPVKIRLTQQQAERLRQD